MTYSLSIKGARAHNPFVPANVIVDDTVAITGGQLNSMQTGKPFLCQNPDGSQSYHVLDESRYVPGGTLYLRRL